MTGRRRRGSLERTAAPPQLAEIPAGYRLAILDPAGTVVDTLELEGHDLRHTLSCVDLGDTVQRAVERREASR